MIGQKTLIHKLSSFTLDTFPHSLLLLGEKGIGKHTLVKYIADNILKLPLVNMGVDISNEYIDNIYRTTSPNIYLIDLNLITEKEQNVILKFIEEPLKNSFVIIICESKNLILETVLNRCVIFEMEPYTKEELCTFISETEDKELVLSFLRTPGKIINTDLSNLKEMCDVCAKIAEKIDKANYSNVLTIANKINYKDEFSKFDLDVFFDVLLSTLYNNYLKSNDKKKLNMYLFSVETRKKLIDKRLNKEVFMYNFLTKLWKLSRA